ncbi:MAG TPA: type II and III secretion system protein family protein [Acetobacteraceae bacterium]|nr:type II and III secretion system protein family protein [Acetobacteraceae bacterium]
MAPVALAARRRAGIPLVPALIALLALVGGIAAAATPPRSAGNRQQWFELETGAGKLLHLPTDAANVFVADPKVAEVHPANAGTLYLFGVGPGRTDVVAVDAAGATLLNATVTVVPSSFAASQAEAEVRRELPGAQVIVRPKTKGLIVTGQVETPEYAARVLAIVRGFAATGDSVEDQLGVLASVQVLLRVRLVEMSRTVVRDLGVNWQALGSIGRFAVSFNTANPVAASLAGTTTNQIQVGWPDINAIINALVQDNLARVLAEPNLTAISGQPASFLEGGEFPIPVGQQNNQVTVEFKQYGVQLAFVPTVLSSGRIDLHVRPEVSELTTQGAVQLTAGNSSLQIPALTVRRADTSVEVGSGQSIVIAGLLEDFVTQGDNGVPGLGDVPVLGALFRSDSFQRQQTELVVVVTPYVVRPNDDPSALRLPAENYRAPTDVQRWLQLRQLGQDIGKAGTPAPGQAGFVVR